MSDSYAARVTEQALNAGQGVLRLAPAWVPRLFSVPGRRLRLHPADLYAMGAQRGGICERWLAATVSPDNGPLTLPDEGLSYVAGPDSARVTLREAIALDGARILGEDSMREHGAWLTLTKLFDNMYPLPHHMHQSDEFAAKVGRRGKPEAYYFPSQYNPTLGVFPYTFFGLEPGTTKDDMIACLKRWDEGDNGILRLSKAYRLEIGTGWDVPPGILHAPGTLVTYEPQRASDVLSMWQSLVADYLLVDRSQLVKDVPREFWDDYDYLVSMLDWDGNVDPAFKAHRFTPPVPAGDTDTMHEAGYDEKWITYASPYFSAKELTILPGRRAVIRDAAAYGAICVQGYGQIGPHTIAAPTMIRFGQMTDDEFFVTHAAAREGVTLINGSASEPLVLLKHFNPGHPELPLPTGQFT